MPGMPWHTLRMSGFVAHCTHAADRKQVCLTSFQPFHAPMHATYIRGHVRLGHACIDYLPTQVYVRIGILGN
jgi:hypothetical protein